MSAKIAERTIVGPEGWQSTWAFPCRLTD